MTIPLSQKKKSATKRGSFGFIGSKHCEIVVLEKQLYRFIYFKKTIFIY